MSDIAATLPALLEGLATRRPKEIAIRHKRLGIWKELTWSDYAQAVREVALGLEALGVRAGERVAILAENDPRWLFADLGVQTLGACSVGIYTALDAAETAVAVNASGAGIVICGDQEQVDKLLEQRAALPGLRTIVVFDSKGLHTPEYADAPIVLPEALRESGRTVQAQRPERLTELLAAGRPESVALLSFTSGTTLDPPRGVMLSHGGEIEMARLVAARIGLHERDLSFSLLPLGHATARLFDAYAPLIAGSSVHFAESIETVASDLVEISPTVLVGTPRLLERIRGEVELRMERAGRLKRLTYRWAMRRLAVGIRAELAGKTGFSATRWIGQLLIGRPVRSKAGLGRLRYGGISGSFVAPDLLTWFWALGLPMYEQYGLVESGGFVTTQRGRADLGTAGTPIDGQVEVRLDAGELLVRSPGLCVGLLDEGGGTPLEDGWLRTGDLARIDDQGRVVPIGRRAHMLVTAAGAEVSPAEIESALKVSPYIASAMVVAAGRPFISAVVELNQDAVAEWARHNDIPVTTYASLAGHARVVELIGAEIEGANARLADDRRVQAFRVLPRPLIDELTPTGKIKRAVVEKHFSAAIEEMYGDLPGVRSVSRA